MLVRTEFIHINLARCIDPLECSCVNLCFNYSFYFVCINLSKSDNNKTNKRY